MSKALKEKILVIVSTIRALFVKVTDSGDRKTSEINTLTKQADKLERAEAVQGQTSKDTANAISCRRNSTKKTAGKEHSMPSDATSTEPIEVALRHEVLPTEKMSRSYAAVV